MQSVGPRYSIEDTFLNKRKKKQILLGKQDGHQAHTTSVDKQHAYHDELNHTRLERDTVATVTSTTSHS